MANFISHIHPMMSHFPIVFIISGFVAETVDRFRKQDTYLKKIGYDFAIIGAIAIILTLLTGLIFTEEQVGKAHDPGELHEHIAYIALGIVVLNALFKYYIKKKNLLTKNNLNISYIISFLSFIAIVITGYLGGRLVYDFLLIK